MNHSENSMSRREMLRAAGRVGIAAVLGSALGRHLSAADAPAESALPQVPRRLLGKTGQKIPILLMGGMPKFDPVFDPRAAECLRFGVNYFDVADCYAGGASESGLGSFLARTGRRKDVWITTKSCNHNPAQAPAVLEISLERLQTDHVELFFLHNLTRPELLDDAMRRMAEDLKKQGKIRFFGFSTHAKGNVPELLEKAAQTPWIDAVMFKYNFRDYDDAALHRAIDAAHTAGVGLIAMKTQGAAVTFEERVKKFEGSQFNRHQAVLKAVWDDERITAAVSAMSTLQQVRENIGAALDGRKLTEADRAALREFADATRHLYCAGCEHICNQAAPAGVRIGTTLRYLMYHDVYGNPEHARECFARLPEAARQFAHQDFGAAAALCPHRIDIGAHMRRAAQVLA